MAEPAVQKHVLQDPLLQLALLPWTGPQQGAPFDLAAETGMASRKTSWGYAYLVRLLQEGFGLDRGDIRLTEERFEQRFEGWCGEHFAKHAPASLQALQAAHQHTQQHLQVLWPNQQTVTLQWTLRHHHAWHLMGLLLEARKTGSDHLQVQLDVLNSFQTHMDAPEPCIVWTHEVPVQDILLHGGCITGMHPQEVLVLHRERASLLACRAFQIKGGFHPDDVHGRDRREPLVVPPRLPLPTLSEFEQMEAGPSEGLRRTLQSLKDPLRWRLRRWLLGKFPVR